MAERMRVTSLMAGTWWELIWITEEILTRRGAKCERKRGVLGERILTSPLSKNANGSCSFLASRVALAPRRRQDTTCPQLLAAATPSGSPGNPFCVATLQGSLLAGRAGCSAAGPTVIKGTARGAAFPWPLSEHPGSRRPCA